MSTSKSLLSLAIVSGLVLSASAEAAGNRKSVAIANANGLIAGPAAAAIHRNGGDSFVAGEVMIDADGGEHVRYQRSYRGLPVIGGDFVVHARKGQVAVSQSLKTLSRPKLSPLVNSDHAVVEAGARFDGTFVGAPNSRMVVYARGATPVLAHEVVLKGIKADQTPTEMHYYVDARSGRILDQWDNVHTALPGPGGRGCTTATAAVGTGKSLTLGDVVLNTSKCGSTFRTVDPTRGGGATHNMGMLTSGMGAVFTDGDNVWGNNLATQSQTVAADVHYGVSATWDYFKNVHGRNGIANNGLGVVSRVHYGQNYANAFWSPDCFCMTFGDGDGVSILPLVALDVAGHEMSHGVNGSSAGLVYSGDAGGLNEANSDIFGTMVEYFANNASDPGDYVIGEELFPNNAAMSKSIRWMFKPSLDSKSYDCYRSTGFSGVDPHYSSGPGNRFFYLLAEGAVVPAGFGAGTWANLTPAQLVCNGNTAITGIGRNAAQKIWYRALTVYMTSSTTYPQARVATINAATDLYGATSVQTNAVRAAWSAVSVN